MIKRIALPLLLLSFMLTGCECEYVRAGYVGVKVYTMGSAKGDMEKVGVGRYYLGPNEDIYVFPTFKQTYNWTKSVLEGGPNDESLSFQTKEGLTVNADVGITYTIDEAKVVDMFKTYRRGINEITDTFLRNHVRDAFNAVTSAMPVESVYGEGKAQLLKDVHKIVAEKVMADGIIVESIFIINEIRLPQAVVDALNAKIAATQQAQQVENELRQAEAEAKKQVATAKGKAEAILAEAESQAKANELLSKSLTPQLVEIKRIEKWDGKLSQVSGGATPFIDMRADGK